MDTIDGTFRWKWQAPERRLQGDAKGRLPADQVSEALVDDLMVAILDHEAFKDGRAPTVEVDAAGVERE